MNVKPTRPRQARAGRPDGVATIVVLAILAILGTLLIVNAKVLERFKREIQLVEQKQVRKFHGPTNAVEKASPRP